MERFLDQIQKGKGSMNEFIQRTEKVTHGVIQQLKQDSINWNFQEYIKVIQEAEIIGKCKMCGEPVYDKGNFYGCSGYKKTKCEFKLSKTIHGKIISTENAKRLLNTGHTSLIKGFKKKGTDKTFDAIIEWNENKKSISFSFPK